MTGIAINLAAAALPYVVQGVAQWVNKSAQTWVPASVANNTIEAAAFAGSKFFGDNVILGKIGSVVGRGFGWMSAPFVAQSAQVKTFVDLTGPLAGGAAGALVQVVAGYAINKLSGNKEEPKETAAQQLFNQQQLLQSQLQLQLLKQMQDQLNAGTKTSHVVVDNKQLEKLAAELKIDVNELMGKLQPKEETPVVAQPAAVAA